ncbi:MAG TPA: hypothetical protein VNM24_04205 [Burkholderiales bacterium]|nr:hypothetical protein [Burkholderiales bacterium]
MGFGIARTRSSDLRTQTGMTRGERYQGALASAVDPRACLAEMGVRQPDAWIAEATEWSLSLSES